MSISSSLSQYCKWTVYNNQEDHKKKNTCIKIISIVNVWMNWCVDQTNRLHHEILYSLTVDDKGILQYIFQVAGKMPIAKEDFLHGYLQEVCDGVWDNIGSKEFIL